MRRSVLLVGAVMFMALVAGCTDDPMVAARDTTLTTMATEMDASTRSVLCNSAPEDAGFVYETFVARWRTVVDLPPPDRGRFDRWLDDEVCAED